MVLNTKYTFSSGAKIAVYTFHGCTIEVLLQRYRTENLHEEHIMVHMVHKHIFNQPLWFASFTLMYSSPLALVLGGGGGYMVLCTNFLPILQGAKISIKTYHSCTVELE